MKPRLPSFNLQKDKPSKSGKKVAGSSISEIPTFECALAQENESSEHAQSLSLAQQIVAGLNGKRSRTSGRMVRRLVALAVEAINELERLSSAGNPHINEVASTRIDWPVLSGHHKSILKKNAAWLERIELGCNARNRILLAQLPARETPARKCALHLLTLVTHIQESAVWGESIHEDFSLCDDSFLRVLRSWLRQNFTSTMFDKVILTWPLVLRIKKLPLLGPEATTIAAWQDATLEFLSLNSNAHPASIPELCALGEHRRFHPYPASTKRALLEQIVSQERQSENISREIREILKDEIRKIGGHIQKLRTPKV